MLIFAFCCFLCSLNTSSTSSTYSSKPRACKAEMTCSPAIVFLFSFSQMSLASEAIKWINSTNHKTRSGQRQSHFDKDLSAYQRIHRWVDRVYLWHRRDQRASFRWSAFAQLLFYGAAYSQCKVSTLNLEGNTLWQGKFVILQAWSFVVTHFWLLKSEQAVARRRAEKKSLCGDQLFSRRSKTGPRVSVYSQLQPRRECLTWYLYFKEAFSLQIILINSNYSRCKKRHQLFK